MALEKSNSPTWDEFLSGFTDYRSITNYFDLYSIADNKNAASVRALFKTNFEEAKQDYVLLTELVMVLNHKLWYWYEKNPESPMVSTYDKLYNKANEYALTHLNDEEIRYFSSITD